MPEPKAQLLEYACDTMTKATRSMPAGLGIPVLCVALGPGGTHIMDMTKFVRQGQDDLSATMDHMCKAVVEFGAMMGARAICTIVPSMASIDYGEQREILMVISADASGGIGRWADVLRPDSESAFLGEWTDLEELVCVPWVDAAIALFNRKGPQTGKN